MNRFAMAIALFTLVSVQLTAQNHDKGYAVGDKIEDFSLLNVDTHNVALKDYTDAKGFIITFTCNHCPYAVAYQDRIIALHNKYAPLGYPVVAINPNNAEIVPEDNFANMQARAKDKAFPFKYLYDKNQTVAHKFGAQRTPHIYIVEKVKGKMVVRYIGAIDDNSEDASAVKTRYAEDALNALLAGKKVAVSQTKAVGCGIKWKK